MKILNAAFDLNRFLKEIGTSDKCVLMLDYDGTIAPFTAERERAYPYPGVTQILTDIMDAHRIYLIIVSGRQSKDIVNLLGLEKPPEIWGCHGWERLMTDGTLHVEDLKEDAFNDIDLIERWIKDMGMENRCERKSSSLALHLRGLEPDITEVLSSKVFKDFATLNLKTDIRPQIFNGGIEFRFSGINKGTAVNTILNEVGEGVPVSYLGDDLTDEDAFRALKGRGLNVLVNEELRPTAADIWIKPPEELFEFLSNWQEKR